MKEEYTISKAYMYQLNLTPGICDMIKHCNTHISNYKKKKNNTQLELLQV